MLQENIEDIHPESPDLEIKREVRATYPIPSYFSFSEDKAFFSYEDITIDSLIHYLYDVVNDPDGAENFNIFYQEHSRALNITNVHNIDIPKLANQKDFIQYFPKAFNLIAVLFNVIFPNGILSREFNDKFNGFSEKVKQLCPEFYAGYQQSRLNNSSTINRLFSSLVIGLVFGIPGKLHGDTFMMVNEIIEIIIKNFQLLFPIDKPINGSDIHQLSKKVKQNMIIDLETYSDLISEMLLVLKQETDDDTYHDKIRMFLKLLKFSVFDFFPEDKEAKTGKERQNEFIKMVDFDFFKDLASSGNKLTLLIKEFWTGLFYQFASRADTLITDEFHTNLKKWIGSSAWMSPSNKALLEIRFSSQSESKDLEKLKMILPEFFSFEFSEESSKSFEEILTSAKQLIDSLKKDPINLDRTHSILPRLFFHAAILSKYPHKFKEDAAELKSYSCYQPVIDSIATAEALSIIKKGGLGITDEYYRKIENWLSKNNFNWKKIANGDLAVSVKSVVSELLKFTIANIPNQLNDKEESILMVSDSFSLVSQILTGVPETIISKQEKQSLLKDFLEKILISTRFSTIYSGDAIYKKLLREIQAIYKDKNFDGVHTNFSKLSTLSTLKEASEFKQLRSEVKPFDQNGLIQEKLKMAQAVLRYPLPAQASDSKNDFAKWLRGKQISPANIAMLSPAELSNDIFKNLYQYCCEIISVTEEGPKPNLIKISDAISFALGVLIDLQNNLSEKGLVKKFWIELMKKFSFYPEKTTIINLAFQSLTTELNSKSSDTFLKEEYKDLAEDIKISEISDLISKGDHNGLSQTLKIIKTNLPAQDYSNLEQLVDTLKRTADFRRNSEISRLKTSNFDRQQPEARKFLYWMEVHPFTGSMTNEKDFAENEIKHLFQYCLELLRDSKDSPPTTTISSSPDRRISSLAENLIYAFRMLLNLHNRPILRWEQYCSDHTSVKQFFIALLKSLPEKQKIILNALSQLEETCFCPATETIIDDIETQILLSKMINSDLESKDQNAESIVGNYISRFPFVDLDDTVETEQFLIGLSQLINRSYPEQIARKSVVEKVKEGLSEILIREKTVKFKVLYAEAFTKCAMDNGESLKISKISYRNANWSLLPDASYELIVAATQDEAAKLVKQSINGKETLALVYARKKWNIYRLNENGVVRDQISNQGIFSKDATQLSIEADRSEIIKQAAKLFDHSQPRVGTLLPHSKNKCQRDPLLAVQKQIIQGAFECKDDSAKIILEDLNRFVNELRSFYFSKPVSKYFKGSEQFCDRAIDRDIILLSLSKLISAIEKFEGTALNKKRLTDTLENIMKISKESGLFEDQENLKLIRNSFQKSTLRAIREQQIILFNGLPSKQITIEKNHSVLCSKLYDDCLFVTYKFDQSAIEEIEQAYLDVLTCSSKFNNDKSLYNVALLFELLKEYSKKISENLAKLGLEYSSDLHFSLFFEDGESPRLSNLSMSEQGFNIDSIISDLELIGLNFSDNIPEKSYFYNFNRYLKKVLENGPDQKPSKKIGIKSEFTSNNPIFIDQYAQQTSLLLNIRYHLNKFKNFLIDNNKIKPEVIKKLNKIIEAINSEGTQFSVILRAIVNRESLDKTMLSFDFEISNDDGVYADTIKIKDILDLIEDQELVGNFKKFISTLKKPTVVLDMINIDQKYSNLKKYNAVDIQEYVRIKSKSEEPLINVELDEKVTLDQVKQQILEITNKDHPKVVLEFKQEILYRFIRNNHQDLDESSIDAIVELYSSEKNSILIKGFFSRLVSETQDYILLKKIKVQLELKYPSISEDVYRNGLYILSKDQKYSLTDSKLNSSEQLEAEIKLCLEKPDSITAAITKFFKDQTHAMPEKILSQVSKFIFLDFDDQQSCYEYFKKFREIISDFSESIAASFPSEQERIKRSIFNEIISRVYTDLEKMLDLLPKHQLQRSIDYLQLLKNQNSNQSLESVLEFKIDESVISKDLGQVNPHQDINSKLIEIFSLLKEARFEANNDVETLNKLIEVENEFLNKYLYYKSVRIPDYLDTFSSQRDQIILQQLIISLLKNLRIRGIHLGKFSSLKQHFVNNLPVIPELYQKTLDYQCKSLDKIESISSEPQEVSSLFLSVLEPNNMDIIDLLKFMSQGSLQAGKFLPQDISSESAYEILMSLMKNPVDPKDLTNLFKLIREFYVEEFRDKNSSAFITHYQMLDPKNKKDIDEEVSKFSKNKWKLSVEQMVEYIKLTKNFPAMEINDSQPEMDFWNARKIIDVLRILTKKEHLDKAIVKGFFQGIYPKLSLSDRQLSLRIINIQPDLLKFLNISENENKITDIRGFIFNVLPGLPEKVQRNYIDKFLNPPYNGEQIENHYNWLLQAKAKIEPSRFPILASMSRGINRLFFGIDRGSLTISNGAISPNQKNSNNFFFNLAKHQVKHELPEENILDWLTNHTGQPKIPDGKNETSFKLDEKEKTALQDLVKPPSHVKQKSQKERSKIFFLTNGFPLVQKREKVIFNFNNWLLRKIEFFISNIDKGNFFIARLIISTLNRHPKKPDVLTNCIDKMSEILNRFEKAQQNNMEFIKSFSAYRPFSSQESKDTVQDLSEVLEVLIERIIIPNCYRFDDHDRQGVIQALESHIHSLAVCEDKSGMNLAVSIKTQAAGILIKDQEQLMAGDFEDLLKTTLKYLGLPNNFNTEAKRPFSDTTNDRLKLALSSYAKLDLSQDIKDLITILLTCNWSSPDFIEKIKVKVLSISDLSSLDKELDNLISYFKLESQPIASPQQFIFISKSIPEESSKVQDMASKMQTVENEVIEFKPNNTESSKPEFEASVHPTISSTTIRAYVQHATIEYEKIAATNNQVTPESLNSLVLEKQNF